MQTELTATAPETQSIGTIRIDKSQPTKGNDGKWESETIVTLNGEDYSITTSKGFDGKLKSSYNKGTFKPSEGSGFYGFNYGSIMSMTPTVLISTVVKQATAKAVFNQHIECLKAFEKKHNCKLQKG